MSPIPRLVTRGLSWQRYLATPRELGWISVYHEGTMYIRRCSAVVPLTLDRGDLKASPELPSGAVARPVTAADERGLRRAFEAAFWETPDFPECTPRCFPDHAREDICNYLEGVEGAPLDASRLVEVDRTVAGAVLLREFRLGPLVDLVFVDPAVQRRGLAGALLARAVAALPDEVTRIYSSVRLANATSLAWHERRGFREVPNLHVQQMRAQHHREEFERHEELGDLSEEELSELRERAAYWYHYVRALQEAVESFDELNDLFHERYK